MLDEGADLSQSRAGSTRFEVETMTRRRQGVSPFARGTARTNGTKPKNAVASKVLFVTPAETSRRFSAFDGLRGGDELSRKRSFPTFPFAIRDQRGLEIKI